ncbi:MAG: DivIVA domain-containing protein [Actinobacteria bacterium]|nr:MAG: DivIVA domain-containing protein [Actinomycetota bacterium]
MAVAISPMDIHLKEFSTVSTEGYDKEEVDSFLDGVADELEKLANKNKELEDAVASMDRKVSQFDEMQKTLQTALMNAQRSAGNILQEARSQAAAIIKRAQDRSDRILEDLEREKTHILSSFSAIRDQIVQQISPMRGLLVKSQSLLIEYEEYTTKADLAAAADSAGVEKEVLPEGAQADEDSDVVVEEVAAPVEEEVAVEVEETAEEEPAEEPAAEREKYVWE